VLLGFVREAQPHAEIRALRPLQAQALAETGRGAQAQALIATTPLDCHRCVVTRGVVAAKAGNVPEAERWLARAARMAPSLPAAQVALAETRLERGDTEGAIRAARAARKLAPNAPEPLKLEADALVRRGDPRPALRLYEQAAERAPRSGRLHLAWARALAAAGERKAARAKFAQALRMDLNAADRAAAAAGAART
jgi:tetratricopeptide (TPR) repeat protein